MLIRKLFLCNSWEQGLSSYMAHAMRSQACRSVWKPTKPCRQGRSFSHKLNNEWGQTVHKCEPTSPFVQFSRRQWVFGERLGYRKLQLLRQQAFHCTFLCGLSEQVHFIGWRNVWLHLLTLKHTETLKKTDTNLVQHGNTKIKKLALKIPGMIWNVSMNQLQSWSPVHACIISCESLVHGCAIQTLRQNRT